jgi:hypothetical protein
MDVRDYSEPALQELLGATAVLPVQYFKNRGQTAVSGERALLWAVLSDGIEVYRRNADARSAAQRVEFAEAEDWIFRTDWEWPCSFMNLCEAFGFNPYSLRRQLLRERTRALVIPRQRFRPPALRAA